MVLDRPKPLYEATKDLLMDRFIEPLRVTGGRIPTGRALASDLGVDVATVSKALNELSREGLVRRRVGSGTYVIPLTERNTPVGLFYDHSIADTRPISAFYRELDTRIQHELLRHEVEPKHYIDLRVAALGGTPFPGLDDDTHNRRVRGLIVLRSHAEQVKWLTSLPGPVVGFEVDYGGPTVRIDRAAFARRGVDALLAQGCRRIALVCAARLKSHSPAPGGREIRDAFLKTLDEAGAPCPPEWIVISEHDLSDDTQGFGAVAFDRLWSAPKRPDGVVVFTDAVCVELLEAARRANVTVGRDIRIASHANRETVLPGLTQVTRVTFSVETIARTLVDRFLDGERGATRGVTYVAPEDIQEAG
ncbi:MAG: substrate-binding domain-containing protein [Phycisphaerae bacterium]|nr:substrate-binding domain-containing protein [Phycisphaerae bacterium]